MYTGDLTLWIEGYFVTGYLVMNSINGVPLEYQGIALVNGQLVGWELDLSFFHWPIRLLAQRGSLGGCVIHVC